MTEVFGGGDGVDGRDSAIQNLFVVFAPRVYRYAYKALGGNAAAADDIVQQVFTAVWDQFDRDFANADEAGAWRLIMTIAARRVTDSRRRAGPAMPVGVYTDADVPVHRAPTDTTDPVERVLQERELRRFLHALTLTLTASEYQIALMVWHLGLSDHEVAEITTIPVRTVRSHKSRARKKIEAMMNTGTGPSEITFDADVHVLGPAEGDERWA
ncbi:RNA polymerase sigma factor [Nocardia blacklockiae]|uniref:RNA polymerase sigma factor n=1 Tax=Nocardia blacklockiae TaxID=480036 RepID=UPI0018963CB2|nr:RNA polymerase sigma factor [Nocardia blacklockiae]MBF6171043.1 RNA polymerase sigma factor [Nocardia blacklockiae]